MRNTKDSFGNFVINPKLELVFNDFAKSIFRAGEYSSKEQYNILKRENKNKHPLVQIAANKNFTELYVNIGAPSDDCK